jgi:hypothetical protein
MRLTWRDAVATGLTGAVLALWAAFLAGVDLPLPGGVRGVAGAVLVIGMVGCAVGGADVARPQVRGWSRTMIRLASPLGVVALLAAVVALLSNSAEALAVLVGATVALWVLATVRHAGTPRTTAARPPAARPGQPVGHG